jgi:hypothetical protein
MSNGKLELLTPNYGEDRLRRRRQWLLRLVASFRGG